MMKKNNNDVQTIFVELQTDLDQKVASIEEIEALLGKTKKRMQVLSEFPFDPNSYQKEVKRLVEQYANLQEQIRQEKQIILRELEQLNRKQSNPFVYGQPEITSSYEFYY